MRSYHQVFVDTGAPAHLPPVHTEKRLSDKASLRITQPQAAELADNGVDRSCCEQVQQQPLLAIEYQPHDVREYTRQAHGNSKIAAAASRPTKHARIQALRRLLKKPMYERTAADNDQLYQLMQSFDHLRAQVPNATLLRELAAVAKLERWPEGDVTLLAHGSLFLVLHGCAVALTEPLLRSAVEGEGNSTDESPSTAVDGESSVGGGITTAAAADDNDEDGVVGGVAGEEDAAFLRRCRTLDKDEQHVVKVGELFGTLRYTEQPQSGDKILSVYLPDDGAEFLKLAAYDYRRLREQMEAKDEAEKVAVLLENPGYALWSRQPLLKVARRLEWLSVPANSVVVSEGYRAPFIGYIQSGSCLLLRKLQVNRTLKNGQEVQQTAHIVMSQVGPKQAFGEASLLSREDMPCTLIAQSESVRMAVLRPDRLVELDADTQLLIGQSADEALGKMPQEEVESEYVVQESAKEWNETKQSVVDDVINTRGIRPGVGKWAK